MVNALIAIIEPMRTIPSRLFAEFCLKCVFVLFIILYINDFVVYTYESNFSSQIIDAVNKLIVSTKYIFLTPYVSLTYLYWVKIRQRICWWKHFNKIVIIIIIIILLYVIKNSR